MKYNTFLSIITISQNCLTNNKIRIKNFANTPKTSKNQTGKGVGWKKPRERCSKA